MDMETNRELYEDMILEHNRHPRNWGKLAHETQSLEGYNPVCGDWLNVHLKVADGVIQDVSIESEGCAISTASASLMSEAVKGMRVEEAEKLFRTVHDKLTGHDASADLGKLEVLTGVKNYPNRVKCATLAWHTLHGALAHQHETVSTEGDAS